jgi:hypothetical protein
MQGLGNFLASFVMFVLLSTGMPRDVAWRLGFALGALPAILAFSFRRRAHSTHDASDEKSGPGSVRVSQWVNLRAAMRVYWRGLLAAAGAWFLLDLTFYGNSLFSGVLLQRMGISSSSRDVAQHNVYLTLLALPGYALAIVLIDRVGRKRLQYSGFFLIGAMFMILGAAFSSLEALPTLLFFLYSLTFLFSNAGPNTTTYVIPAEFFPSEVRTTCHGIASAAGKVGAAIAAYTFPVIQERAGVPALMIICGAVALLGGVWTLVVLPSYHPVNHERNMHRKRGRYQAAIARILREQRPRRDPHAMSADKEIDAGLSEQTGHSEHGEPVADRRHESVTSCVTTSTDASGACTPLEPAVFDFEAVHIDAARQAPDTEAAMRRIFDQPAASRAPVSSQSVRDGDYLELTDMHAASHTPSASDEEVRPVDKAMLRDGSEC